MSHWASCCLIRKAVPRTKPTNRKLIPTVLYAIERAVTHTSRALLDHSSQSSEVSSRFSKSSTTSSGASSRSFQSSHFKTREIRTKLTMIAMIMTMEAPKRRRWIFLPFWRLFPQHSHDHIPVAVTIMEPYVRPRTTPPQSPPTVERRAPIRARMPMTCAYTSVGYDEKQDISNHCIQHHSAGQYKRNTHHGCDAHAVDCARLLWRQRKLDHHWHLLHRYRFRRGDGSGMRRRRIRH
mmetsp:Transcript_21283/g.50475  ORF Transcript_21283/g.50475 Transcript_21283/m.50475 type:complete len:237 (+) Transcript_21283:212-922(+)